MADSPAAGVLAAPATDPTDYVRLEPYSPNLFCLDVGMQSLLDEQPPKEVSAVLQELLSFICMSHL